ncbi:MAG: hypothetical protein ACRD22_01195 [Terriglobia bacterium]
MADTPPKIGTQQASGQQQIAGQGRLLSHADMQQRATAVNPAVADMSGNILSPGEAQLLENGGSTLSWNPQNPPALTGGMNKLGPPHPYQSGPLGWSEKLNDKLAASVPGKANWGGRDFARFVAGPVFAPVDALASGQLALQGHPVKAFNRGAQAIGEAVGPLAAITAPEAIPAMAGMTLLNQGETSGLQSLGISPESSQAISNLTSLLMGTKVPMVREEGSPENFTHGINKFEQALSPARSSRNLDVHNSIVAAAPDLREIATAPEMRQKRLWRRSGVPKSETANALASALHNHADTIYAKRAKMMSPFNNVFVSAKPIGDEVNKLVVPDLFDPQSKMEMQDIVQAAAPFSNRNGAEMNVPLRSLENQRQRYRSQLRGNWFTNQKADLQKVAEAKHRGSVKAVENAMNQLQDVDMPRSPANSMRKLNMQAGRLDALGDRLAIRAIGSNFRDPNTAERLLHGGHTFISAHGGTPYIGVFANPTSLVEGLTSPRSANGLARAALRNFGRPNRVSLLPYLADKFKVYRGVHPEVTPGEQFDIDTKQPPPTSGLLGTATKRRLLTGPSTRRIGAPNNRMLGPG